MSLSINKSLIDDEVSKSLIIKLIKKHRMKKGRFDRLERYYDADHEILKRTLDSESLPNNKLVCNHAKYIADMASAYFIGEPVVYESDIDIEDIKEIFKHSDESSHNSELAEDASIFGVAYELVYINDDAEPSLIALDVKETFVVTDDTVAKNALFAVNYYQSFDEDDKENGFIVNVYDAEYHYEYYFNELDENSGQLKKEEVHYFNAVPIVEYLNNKREQGDYEQVITLIDAYNLLQSDRVNDKEQLVDAILALYGSELDEEGAKLLKQYKMLNMQTGDKAEWLIKQLNEQDTEVLKRAIEEDIHKFSMVPCLTDKNFIGNSSGVAMKYKLLGLEQLSKRKERYFSVGLRERLKLISNIQGIKGSNLDIKCINIIYSRSLPANELEISQLVNNLQGIVSNETLVSKIPFIADAVSEIEKLRAEKLENFEHQQKQFGFPVDSQDEIDENSLDEK